MEVRPPTPSPIAASSRGIRLEDTQEWTLALQNRTRMLNMRRVVEDLERQAVEIARVRNNPQLADPVPIGEVQVAGLHQFAFGLIG